MKSGLICVILAGGLGTRLRSILPDTPKPMACINGRPFLEYLLTQIRLAGYTDVILCVGYKAEVIENHFTNGRRYGVQIRYSRERELSGTAGALSQARHLIRSDPFLVMNGDSYCAVNFEELISQHQARSAVASIVTTRIEDRSRCGSVGLGPRDSIVRFAEKAETRGSGYINAGIYLINQTVLDLIPAGKYFSLERDIFPSLVGRGLYAFKTSGVFIDIGTPSELQQAQTVLKDYLGVDL
jgi:D-glycero-alpha-D-manno-heptose 1-phosphate guanylyltransferase